jgi:hypothetical protein
MAKDAILQICTSFQATIDGQLVSFVAGKLIPADHEAVAKWPQYFRSPEIDYPVKRTAEPVIEQATAAPGEKRGR